MLQQIMNQYKTTGNHAQGTQASTAFQTQQFTTSNVENIQNYAEVYNEMGLNSHLESYSVKQELIRLANDKYKVADNKKLVEKVQDLENSLLINKNMLNALLTSDGNTAITES